MRFSELDRNNPFVRRPGWAPGLYLLRGKNTLAIDIQRDPWILCNLLLSAADLNADDWDVADAETTARLQASDSLAEILKV